LTKGEEQATEEEPADGNGRMGRMWQTLLLYRWKKIFAWLPVENVIRRKQEAYYESIRASTRESRRRGRTPGGPGILPKA